jgi:group I intron endonuclease
MDNLGKIYLIKNIVNNKEYVGCTISKLNVRFDEHMWKCTKSDSKTKFCNSIKKYGKENFKIELLENCDVKTIYEREIFYIQKFNTYKNGLNSTTGGEGCLGYTHTEETRKKISTIIKNGKSHKGKTYDEIYGERKNIEKENRKIGVKKSWDNLTNEEKTNRIKNSQNQLRNKSKYGLDLIKEIKSKFEEGFKVKNVKLLYPLFPESYLYSIKNNKRWKNI